MLFMYTIYSTHQDAFAFKQTNQIARTFPADQDDEHEVECSWFSQELGANVSPSEWPGEGNNDAPRPYLGVR
jgi:hypothetical protein